MKENSYFLSKFQIVPIYPRQLLLRSSQQLPSSSYARLETVEGRGIGVIYLGNYYIQ
nr:MAG TPA: hypothetical protein [Caudoviricetes sp.]